jgi:hypothetical protein
MRIRTIKPEFFLHEGLFDAESESGLPIRIAFAGLWCAADREGRFKWEPRKLGIQILPWDGCDFSRVLDALTTRGFVVKYTSGTDVFGWIPSFLKHQVINNRERPSELPNPLECNQIDASTTREARVDHAGQGEGKGREQGKEGKGKELLSVKPDEYPPIVENLWKLFPPNSRLRSSKFKLHEQWRKLKAKPDEQTITDSLTKWASCHEWTKDGGQFAPGAHFWLKDRKWESEPISANAQNQFRGTNEALSLKIL